MRWLPKAPKARRRMLVLLAVAPILTGAVALSLWAMREQVTFFYSPTEALEAGVEPGVTVRLGGLVVAGSVAEAGAGVTRFEVSDGQATTTVVFAGDLPDLFREGQGIVAQGAFAADGTFRATQVLAKHDETYMPREVADALKARGEWREGEPAPGPAR